MNNEFTTKLKYVTKKFCEAEAMKNPLVYRKLYSDQLDKALKDKVMMPYCRPYSDKARKHSRLLINSEDIYVDADFEFLHHSYDELLQYAVDTRDDIDLHIDDMNGLHLDQYLSPFGYGDRYMVSDNGGHRLLVFKCIGFPKVSAVVQERTGNYWRYAYHDGCDQKQSNNIIYWFEYLGLIRIVKVEYDYYVIESVKSAAAWILPDPKKCFRNNIMEIRKRLGYLKCNMTVDELKDYKIFDSILKCRISMLMSRIELMFRIKMPKLAW